MTGTERVTVYASDSQLRRPRQFLWETRRGLIASAHLAPRLTAQSLRSQYRSSLLGYFWIIGPSIGVTIVWLYLNRANVVATGETRIPYGVYVLVGTLLWMSFGEAMQTPIAQLSSASNLLSKVQFPAESLQLAGLLTVIVNATVRLLLVIPVFALSGVRPSRSIAVFPIALMALLLLGFSVGLVLAPVGALYRDIGQSLTIALAFLFLVTPVAYASTTETFIGRYNPITPMLEAARDALTGGPVSFGPQWWAVVLVTLALLVIGWMLFRLAVPHLSDRISP